MCEWISVKERLPDGQCLATSMVHGPSYKEYLVGWVGEDEGPGTGYICECDSVMLYNVTHWMPLPSTEGLNDDA